MSTLWSIAQESPPPPFLSQSAIVLHVMAQGALRLESLPVIEVNKQGQDIGTLLKQADDQADDEQF